MCDVVIQRKIMIDFRKAIVFWGILDLCSISWYIGARFYNGVIPFYSDIVMAHNTALSFDHPLPIIFAVITIVMHTSLIFSGILLIKQNKYGAIISYIQTPFRLLFRFLPPSIFFIYWPVGYLFDVKETSKLLLGVLIVILTLSSEVPKLYTVIKWHKKIKNSK